MPSRQADKENLSESSPRWKSTFQKFKRLSSNKKRSSAQPVISKETPSESADDAAPEKENGSNPDLLKDRDVEPPKDLLQPSIEQEEPSGPKRRLSKTRWSLNVSSPNEKENVGNKNTNKHARAKSEGSGIKLAQGCTQERKAAYVPKHASSDFARTSMPKDFSQYGHKRCSSNDTTGSGIAPHVVQTRNRGSQDFQEFLWTSRVAEARDVKTITPALPGSENPQGSPLLDQVAEEHPSLNDSNPHDSVISQSSKPAPQRKSFIGGVANSVGEYIKPTGFNDNTATHKRLSISAASNKKRNSIRSITDRDAKNRLSVGGHQTWVKLPSDQGSENMEGLGRRTSFVEKWDDVSYK